MVVLRSVWFRVNSARFRGLRSILDKIPCAPKHAGAVLEITVSEEISLIAIGFGVRIEVGAFAENPGEIALEHTRSSIRADNNISSGANPGGFT